MYKCRLEQRKSTMEKGSNERDTNGIHQSMAMIIQTVVIIFICVRRNDPQTKFRVLVAELGHRCGYVMHLQVCSQEVCFNCEAWAHTFAGFVESECVTGELILVVDIALVAVKYLYV